MAADVSFDPFYQVNNPPCMTPLLNRHFQGRVKDSIQQNIQAGLVIGEEICQLIHRTIPELGIRQLVQFPEFAGTEFQRSALEQVAQYIYIFAVPEDQVGKHLPGGLAFSAKSSE
jgi:hypothetical protein